MALKSAHLQELTLLVLLTLSTFGRAGADDDSERCLKCHGDPKIATMRPESMLAMVRIPEGQSPVLRSPSDTAGLYRPETEFSTTAHGGLSCTACHLGIDRLPHDQRLATLKCQDCHAEEEKVIESGPHGAASKTGGRAKPDCQGCHGPSHQIQSVRFPRDTDQAKAIVQRCETCHDQDGGAQGASHGEFYQDNVHGKALFEKGLGVSAICTDCHGNHAMLPPSNPESPLNPLRVPATCGKCHQGIENVYFASIHGQNVLAGRENAATCTSCHNSHGIQTVGRPFLKAVVKECSHCHLSLGESYLTSYHGKVTQLGSESAAVCSSCHGAHDILPKSDPLSRIAPGNLVKTCGKCHSNANKNFVKYEPHMNVLDWKGQPIIFATWLGMTVLLLSVLAFFITHTLLWFQRSFVEHKWHHGTIIRRYQPNERMFRRFRPVHRITHALVIVSFMGLVATGFPMKYSNADWAKNMTALFGGVAVMRIVHRCLAVVTFSYAAVHIAFLVHFFRKHRPKERMKYLLGPDSMIPNLRDLKDFIAMMRWFLWLGPRPRFERWTYYEKFDYFGEAWGVFLIGGTGLMLWFPTLFTRWLPGWVLNSATVIHSIEALLAASVIFLVHFFNTHLRPGKFPIDMVMLTGQMPESEMIEERGDEYERLKASGKLEERIVPPVPRRWRIAGAIAGIAAFLFGMTLIALALSTELAKLWK